jgi:hypothetical protein
MSGSEKKIICDYEFPAQLDDKLLATVSEWLPHQASAMFPSEIANNSVMILHPPESCRRKRKTFIVYACMYDQKIVLGVNQIKILSNHSSPSSTSD